MAKNEIKVYTVVDASGAQTGIALTEKEFAKLAPAAEKAATGSTKHLQSFAQSLPGVGGAIGGLNSKMGETGNVAGDLGGSFGKLGGAAVAGVAVAGVAFAEFALKGAEKFEQLAVSVEKFSTVAGTTTQEASKFVAVGEQFGVGADTLATGVGKLGKSLGNNIDALGKYGVSAVLAKDGNVDLEATTLKVVDAYNATEDPAKRAALGAAAFGKGYQALIPLITEGSAKIKEAMDGVSGARVLSPEQVAQAKEFGVHMVELKQKFQDVQLELGEKLMPAILGVMDGLSKIAGPVATGVGAAFDGFVTGVRAVATALTLGHHDFLAYGDDAKGQASTFVDAATGAQLLQQRYMELAKQGVGPLADSVKQATDAQMAYNTSLDAYTGPSQGMLANTNTLIPPLDNLAKSYLGLNDPLGQAALNITAVNKALAVPIGNFDADAIKLSTDAMARWKAQTDAALKSVQVGLDQTKFKWDALTGDVTDDQAWINLQQAFDDTKTKGTDAMETIAQRVKDLQKSGMTLAEAQKQAAIDDAAAKRAAALGYDDLKLKVINFGKEIDGLPLEKVTSLKAELVAGELDRVENQLEILTRNRTVNLDIIAKGGAGYGTTTPGGARAAGGPVTRGVTYLVGEHGPEPFTPSVSGMITPNSGLRAMSGGGTTINNNYYNVNVPPNYDKVAFGRLIEESRSAHQRSGGTLVS